MPTGVIVNALAVLIGGIVGGVGGKYLSEKFKTEIKNVDNNSLVSFVEMASVSDGGFIVDSVDRPLGDLRKGSTPILPKTTSSSPKSPPAWRTANVRLLRG